LYRQAVKLVKQQQPLCGDVSSDALIEQKLQQAIQALQEHVKEGETGVLEKKTSCWLRVISINRRRPMTALRHTSMPSTAILAIFLTQHSCYCQQITHGITHQRPGCVTNERQVRIRQQPAAAVTTLAWPLIRPFD
jgi:hypothetical protein